MKRLTLILLFASSLAYASGQVSVMDPITKNAKYLKGGTGINIGTDGTFSATGVAVPISIQPYSNISTAIKDRWAQTGAASASAFASYTSAHKNLAGTAGNLDGGTATSTFLTQIDGGGAY